MLLDGLRISVVWLVELVLYYGLTSHAADTNNKHPATVSCGGVGEAWNRFSAVQLTGFVVQLTGALLYNGLLPLPRAWTDWLQSDSSQVANSGALTSADPTVLVSKEGARAYGAVEHA